MLCFFFFQAEDGIRDLYVTGVQTCALPISPGWYAHLWRAPDRIAERWVVSAATLLRQADMPASTAAALEAVRLAQALAAVRDRALPGLSELTDAVRSVLCHGEDVPLSLITSKLVIG